MFSRFLGRGGKRLEEEKLLGKNAMSLTSWSSLHHRRRRPTSVPPRLEVLEDRTVPSTFDAAADFSATQNPNGNWQYGWTSSLGSSFQRYTYTETVAGIIDEWTINRAAPPRVWHNPSGSTVTAGSLVMAPGELGLHPGGFGEYSVVRFTAPTAGTVTAIDGVFSGNDSTGTTTDVHILRNSSQIFAGFVNGYGATAGFSLSTPLAMLAGDTIDFAVGYGIDGNYFGDSTALAANIEFDGQSDIDMQSAQLLNGNSVQFTYQTTGNPGSFTVALYPSADGKTFDSSSAPIATGTEMPADTTDPQSGQLTIPSTWTPDPTTPFIVVAANLDRSVTESSYNNNIASVELPDLIPSLAASAIHHLIYRGQNLSVPLIVNNQGGDATGNINLEYYLSTSQDATVDGPGDYLLKTDTIDATTLPVGQAYSPTPVVTIPSFIVKDTYYLKVRISGASSSPTIESDTSNNIVVSEPLWVCSETNTMTGVRASVYEEAVAQAKESPLDPNAVFNVDTVAKTKIKAAERLFLYPYVDSEGIPTIGYGMALKYKDKHGNIVDNPVAKQRIKDANLVYPDDGPVAKLRGKKLNFNDIIDLAYLWKQDHSSAVNIITPALAEVWFNSDYDAAKGRVGADGIDLTKYTRYAQVALIDFYFNGGYLSAYTNAYQAIRAYATASAEDKPHLMACAAFEILDSKRTDQIAGTSRDRLVEMFRYFVAGYESVL